MLLKVSVNVPYAKLLAISSSVGRKVKTNGISVPFTDSWNVAPFVPNVPVFVTFDVVQVVTVIGGAMLVSILQQKMKKRVMSGRMPSSFRIGVVIVITTTQPVAAGTL